MVKNKTKTKIFEKIFLFCEVQQHVKVIRCFRQGKRKRTSLEKDVKVRKLYSL